MTPCTCCGQPDGRCPGCGASHSPCPEPGYCEQCYRPQNRGGIEHRDELDPEGVQEFVAVMQGVVDEHRQRKRSNTVRRARRSRINKRGF